MRYNHELTTISSKGTVSPLFAVTRGLMYHFPMCRVRMQAADVIKSGRLVEFKETAVSFNTEKVQDYVLKTSPQEI